MHTHMHTHTRTHTHAHTHTRTHMHAHILPSHMDRTQENLRTEVSEKEKEIPYDIPYMWNLKYGTNEPIYKIRNRLTGIESRFVIAKKGDGGYGKIGLEVWD